jgi:spectinomycin phosphotransferase/16S rRNA (guanine(1405)-N(7))-methyltransferase
LSRPRDLSDATLARALLDGWGLTVAAIEYLPVGFGSHHWGVAAEDESRWFVTVDEDASDESLRMALAAAIDLRDAGLSFVVAPIPTRANEPLLALGRFAVACYPYVEGESIAWNAPPHDWGDAILEMLLTLHHAETDAHADDFVIRHRDGLIDLSVPDAGPYSRPTAALLADRGADIRAALARYDALVARTDEQRRRVVTHGEPHPGNTMRTANGWMLIDWDTVRVAPPERDLWDLETLWGPYEEVTGTALHPPTLELYRLGWDLKDLALYVARFRRPHDGDDDDAKSWEGANESASRL